MSIKKVGNNISRVRKNFEMVFSTKTSFPALLVLLSIIVFVKSQNCQQNCRVVCDNERNNYQKPKKKLLRGKHGPRGPKGEVRPPGPAGLPGRAGHHGDRGDKGDRGIPGLKGEIDSERLEMMERKIEVLEKFVESYYSKMSFYSKLKTYKFVWLFYLVVV